MEDVSIAFLLTVALVADASAKLFINVSIVSPLPVELLIHVRQAGLEAEFKSQEKDLSVGCNTGEFWGCNQKTRQFDLQKTVPLHETRDCYLSSSSVHR
jgi:hypothetical protein